MISPVGLVMATPLEAAPFIGEYVVEPVDEKPFRVYRGERHVLVLCGIGKARAAMATALLIQRFSPSVMINLGAAGALRSDFHVGDILQIDRVLEPDRPALVSGRERVAVPATLDGFASASLATQDRPMVSPDDRRAAGRVADLADMEGAGFLQACRLMETPAYLFKLVTDTIDDDTDKTIIENVRRTAPLLAEFYGARILPLLLSL